MTTLIQIRPLPREERVKETYEITLFASGIWELNAYRMGAIVYSSDPQPRGWLIDGDWQRPIDLDLLRLHLENHGKKIALVYATHRDSAFAGERRYLLRDVPSHALDFLKLCGADPTFEEVLLAIATLLWRSWRSWKTSP